LVSFPRRPTSSMHRCATTCASRSRARPMRRSKRRRARHRSTSSSRRCQMATTRWSGSAGTASRAARSGWRRADDPP
jgi:hypothetical protein